jgi:hypothetical protein
MVRKAARHSGCRTQTCGTKSRIETHTLCQRAETLALLLGTGRPGRPPRADPTAVDHLVTLCRIV